MHATILDAAYPGYTNTLRLDPTVAPYATSPELGQSEPALAVYGDRIVVAWRSTALAGDPIGSELWLREIKLAPGGVANTISPIAER